MDIESITTAQKEKIKLQVYCIAMYDDLIAEVSFRVQEKYDKWKTMNKEGCISDLMVPVEGSCNDDLVSYLSINQKKILDDINSYDLVLHSNEVVDSVVSTSTR